MKFTSLEQTLTAGNKLAEFAVLLFLVIFDNRLPWATTDYSIATPEDAESCGQNIILAAETSDGETKAIGTSFWQLKCPITLTQNFRPLTGAAALPSQTNHLEPSWTVAPLLAMTRPLVRIESMHPSYILSRNFNNGKLPSFSQRACPGQISDRIDRGRLGVFLLFSDGPTDGLKERKPSNYNVWSCKLQKEAWLKCRSATSGNEGKDEDDDAWLNGNDEDREQLGLGVICETNSIISSMDPRRSAHGVQFL
ncbi:hypothetical protein C8J57DRAFT_1223854 [Mycena rebaudengoi]|nr:hypothetical protein C8J57DRAFT_1223854 [Mycena rebaudengoi]